MKAAVFFVILINYNNKENCRYFKYVCKNMYAKFNDLHCLLVASNLQA